MNNSAISQHDNIAHVFRNMKSFSILMHFQILNMEQGQKGKPPVVPIVELEFLIFAHLTHTKKGDMISMNPEYHVIVQHG